jgi:Spy/CpxP family protein refolding chaperone
MNRIALSLIALTAGATPLAAQHDHQAPPPRTVPAQQTPTPSAPCPMGMQGGMGMMMPGMDSMMGPLHAVMAYAPRRLLERKAALRLDSDQESRLAGITAVSQPVHDSARAAADQHRRQLHEAMAAAAPDPASVAAHFAGMHAAMGTAHEAMLRAALESRALLTVGQRSLVEAPSHDAGMHHQTPPQRGSQPGHEGHHAPRRP